MPRDLCPHPTTQGAHRNQRALPSSPCPSAFHRLEHQTQTESGGQWTPEDIRHKESWFETHRWPGTVGVGSERATACRTIGIGLKLNLLPVVVSASRIHVFRN